MKKITILLIAVIPYGCSNNTNTEQQSNQEIESSKTVEKFEISYDKSKVSDFSIEKTEDLSIKAMDRKLSEYSTGEVDKLPTNKKLSYSIVVPTEISKESLENTLKHFVAEKTSEDNDIDEIIIFVYDSKNDIGKLPYTFGKLVWAPKGKLGNVTSEIALKNNRDNYKFEIEIKDKVGNIRKSDMPTEREFAIYDMVMDPKYSSLSDDALDKKVMQEFGIKSKEELDSIFLKVMKYKM